MRLADGNAINPMPGRKYIWPGISECRRREKTPGWAHLKPGTGQKIPLWAHQKAGTG
jgi:hypothetical protein